MKFKVESERKKFIARYDIDMEKYTTDETVDQLEQNISNVLLFWLNIILPIAIICLISIAVSVYFGYRYNSIGFGIWLFMSLVPIFLFGAGSFGVVRAINTLRSCINYILNYTLKIITDIKRINEVNNSIKTSEICQFTLYGIVFPVVKKCIRNRFFGGILYFFIKKISIQGATLLSTAYEKNERDILLEEIQVDNNEKQFIKIPKAVNAIAKKAVISAILLFKVVGFFSILFGIILVATLFFIY